MPQHADGSPDLSTQEHTNEIQLSLLQLFHWNTHNVQERKLTFYWLWTRLSNNSRSESSSSWETTRGRTRDHVPFNSLWAQCGKKTRQLKRELLFFSISTKAPFHFYLRPTKLKLDEQPPSPVIETFLFASGSLTGCYLCAVIRAVSPTRSTKGAARSSAIAAAALSQRSGMKISGMHLPTWALSTRPQLPPCWLTMRQSSQW